MWLKISKREIAHGSNQHSREYINAEEKYYREILQESFSQWIIDKWPSMLFKYRFWTNQVLSHKSMVVKIEESMLDHSMSGTYRDLRISYLQMHTNAY